MSKVECGASTVVSTGTEIFILNDDTIDIQSVVLFISSSATESSAGFSNLTTTYTGSAAYWDENTTKTITHYRNVSGVKTKVFEAVVTALDVGEFTLSVTTCTQTTQVKYVAYGS